MRRLLAEQLPSLGGLPLRRVEPRGTDHAIFRLGRDLAARLPRVHGRSKPGSKGNRVATEILRVAARRCSSSRWRRSPWRGVSVVLGDPHLGRRSDGACRENRRSRGRTRFERADQRVKRVGPGGAPLGRGVPLAERDEAFRYWLERFDGDARVGSEWESALAAPPWDGAPVWHHGDLDARNWLIRDGRIRGVIDWGCMGVGDPACDLMVAWKPAPP